MGRVHSLSSGLEGRSVDWLRPKTKAAKSQWCAPVSVSGLDAAWMMNSWRELDIVDEFLFRYMDYVAAAKHWYIPSRRHQTRGCSGWYDGSGYVGRYYPDPEYMNYPLKAVTGTVELTNKYCRPGEGCRRHNLECGHYVICKQSAGFARRKRCRDCHLGRPADIRK